MAGTAIVDEIVDILVAGLTGLGQGIGSAVSTFATSLAFTGTGNDQTLSVYFVLVICFAGVALAIALTSRIFQWLTSLGN